MRSNKRGLKQFRLENKGLPNEVGVGDIGVALRCDISPRS